MMARCLVPVSRLMDRLRESLTLSVVAVAVVSPARLVYLYIYFTTSDTTILTLTLTLLTPEIINNDSVKHLQTVCSSTPWLKIQPAQSVKMFPPVAASNIWLFDAKYPCDASWTPPVYSQCTSVQPDRREGDNQTDQYWAWGGERGQVWLLLSAQTVCSTLTPHTSHLTPHTSHLTGLNTLYFVEIPYLDIKLPYKLVKSSALSLSLYKHFTKLTIYTIRIILDSFLTKLNYVVN